jgi:hypothetical protein
MSTHDVVGLIVRLGERAAEDALLALGVAALVFELIAARSMDVWGGDEVGKVDLWSGLD